MSGRRVRQTGIDAIFGARVASMRAIRGLKQIEFLRLLEARGEVYDSAALSRIENGKRSVRLSEAMLMAEVLDVALSELVPGVQPNGTLPSVPVTALHELVAKWGGVQ